MRFPYPTASGGYRNERAERLRYGRAGAPIYSEIWILQVGENRWAYGHDWQGHTASSLWGLTVDRLASSRRIAIGLAADCIDKTMADLCRRSTKEDEYCGRIRVWLREIRPLETGLFGGAS